MKIYFTKYGREITGAQVVSDDGTKHELSTDSKLCGLWCDDKQVIGTCDFDLRCCAQTARNRLINQAVYRCQSQKAWWDECEEQVTVSRKPLF